MPYTYTRKTYERESDSKSYFSSYSATRPGKAMNRLLVLLMMTISLVFAGTQTTPTAQASFGCELVCGEPFIDPNDGQCYVMCCPEDDKCARRCELIPCKGGSEAQ